MNKSNDQLNDLFTVYVAGYPTTALAGEAGRKYRVNSENTWLPLPDFCNDVGAVFEWLSALGCWTAAYNGVVYSVGLRTEGRLTAYGTDTSLARAAMIACLNAKGITS